MIPAPSDEPVAVSEVPPWRWSWTQWRQGEAPTFFFLLLIHAGALPGLLLFPLPGWTVFLLMLALGWLGGIGASISYHRALAHGSLRVNRATETVLTALAVFNANGTPASWTANHRLHHAKVETHDDVSSPRVGGFWWSHYRWLYQARQAPVTRWAPRLDTPYYRAWSRWQPHILISSFLVGLALVPWLGWAAFFWLGPIRLVWTLNAQCFVNSAAHMRSDVGEGEDSSQNLRWLGVLQAFVGENWHRNHHENPACARLGRTWAQIDTAWYVIALFRQLGLVSNVRTPVPSA